MTVTRLAVLVKQIPASEEMALGPRGHLIRDVPTLEMSAYLPPSGEQSGRARRRRSQLLRRRVHTRSPAAEDVLREAIAPGLDRGVETRGVLVTDQIGITGRSISPRLYVAIGKSDKFNHMVGARSAAMVLAINPDRNAPVFDNADVGIVADWRECIAILEAEIRQVIGRRRKAAGSH